MCFLRFLPSCVSDLQSCPLLVLLPVSHHLNSRLFTSHFRIDHLRSGPFVLCGGAANADLRREQEEEILVES